MSRLDNAKLTIRMTSANLPPVHDSKYVDEQAVPPVGADDPLMTSN